MTRKDAIANDTAWYIRRVRLNQGGYTDRGYYYGIGEPLYECYTARDYVTFRARDRRHAIEQLRDHMQPHKIWLHKN
jgi:hypothetical protein